MAPEIDDLLRESPHEMIERVFVAAKHYHGWRLIDWFQSELGASQATLDKSATNFLQTMATWVFRRLRNRHGQDVPLGTMARFVHPDEQVIDLEDAIKKFLVRLLRKRGLREVDEHTNGPAFEEMVRAFDRASSQRR